MTLFLVVKKYMANNVYLVISQTGTVLSRILKLITKADYNHSSISLRDDLHCMYSFGRMNPYNPFWGGFVEESAEWGTFKRFSETKAIVLSLDVGEVSYNSIKNEISYMLENRKNFHYNYLALFLALVKKTVKRKNYYDCSEFVRDILIRNGIESARDLPEIIKPIHFLSLPDTKEIYKGKLREFKQTVKN